VLLRGLLRISATDSEPRVRQACAACLGELGAVDPSRLLITIGNSSSSATGKQQHISLIMLPSAPMKRLTQLGRNNCKVRQHGTLLPFTTLYMAY
jgi:hypothetical protein